jgi:uncharacterized membrane protein
MVQHGCMSLHQVHRTPRRERPGDPPTAAGAGHPPMSDVPPRMTPTTRLVSTARRLAAVPVVLPALVFGLMAAYLVAFSLRRYVIGVPAYDAGYFGQAAWLISHGRSPVVTVRGLHLLGDHSYLGFYPVAALTRLGEPVVVLFVLQAIAIAAAVFPLAAFCRRVAGLGTLGTASVLVAYAFLPAAHNINGADFHPESLAVPFMVGACLAGATRRWVLLAVCVLVTLSLREDLAVSMAVLGVVLFFTVSRKAGAVLAIGSGIAYVLATRVLIPHFAGGVYVQEGQLSQFGGSLTGLLRSILTDPLAAVAHVWDAGNGMLLLALLAPLGFLGLSSVRWLLPAVPVQAALLFTDREVAHTIEAQYVTQAVPFLAVAAAAGLGRLASAGPAVPRAFAPALIGAAVISWVALANDVPASPVNPWEENAQRNEAMRAATATVPSDAAVTATPGAWVHLAERPVLFPYPEEDASFFVADEHRITDVACWAVVAVDEPAYRDAPPGPDWDVVFEQDVYQVLRRC